MNRTDSACMEIMLYGHPALRRKAKPIGGPTPAVRRLAVRMVATMFENETRGIGLAAPQVGVGLRLVTLAIYDDPADVPEDALPGDRYLCSIMPCALIDPDVQPVTEETEAAIEGCLSIPGVSEEVIRPTLVRLRATLLNGTPLEVVCSGLLSRCLQHEIDHLDGVMFVDRVSREALDRVGPQLKALESQARRQEKRTRRAI